MIDTAFMHHDVAEAIDTIDAAMFTGDEFQSATSRKALRDFITRWLRELDGVDAYYADKT